VSVVSAWRRRFPRPVRYRSGAGQILRADLEDHAVIIELGDNERSEHIVRTADQSRKAEIAVSSENTVGDIVHSAIDNRR
jgi:hypothetical protein